MTVLADVTEEEPMWEAAMQLATPARTPATRQAPNQVISLSVLPSSAKPEHDPELRSPDIANNIAISSPHESESTRPEHHRKGQRMLPHA